MNAPAATWIERAADFEALLEGVEPAVHELWIAIYKKSSKKQTVMFGELLDVAICYGWVDVQTEGIDEERYGIRFVPRKPSSNWSAINRDNVCRLMAEGRMQQAGIELLPADLVCP